MTGVIFFVLRHPITFYKLWRGLYQLEVAQRRLGLMKEENTRLKHELAVGLADKISNF